MSYHLPKKIPIFPLRGVIFFPETNLPLNIFENRYLKMVNYSLARDRLIGMIQSDKNKNYLSLDDVNFKNKTISQIKNLTQKELIEKKNLTKERIILKKEDLKPHLAEKDLLSKA